MNNNAKLMRKKSKRRLVITLLSILFGGGGILTLVSSIIAYRTEKEILAYSFSTDVSARSVRWARYSDRRKFNEGLYPRDMLDTLEADYDNYADWTELHLNYLDSLMDLREPIDLDIIGEPNFLSSLTGELIDIRNRYLQEIEEYNIQANELKKSKEKSKEIHAFHPFTEVLSVVSIVLSYILQLILAFCNYFNEKKSIE